MKNKLPILYKNADFFIDLETKTEKIEQNIFYYNTLKSGQRVYKFSPLLLKYTKKLKINFFFDLSIVELSLIKKYFKITFERKMYLNLWSKTQKFYQDIENSKKYQKFIRKNKNLKIYFEYDWKKVENFFQAWSEEFLEKKGEAVNVKLSDISNLFKEREKYGAKFIFLEIEGELVGFSAGANYSPTEKNIWIPVYNYSFRSVRNSALFLKYQRAKLFQDKEFFIDAVYFGNESLLKYKKDISLPWKEEVSFLVKI